MRDKYRFARWGRRKIELALRQKRVDADIIAEALEEIDEDEYTEVLRQLIVLKSRLLGVLTPMMREAVFSVLRCCAALKVQL